MTTATEASHQGSEKAHKGKDLFNALVPIRAWVHDKQLRSWMTALLVVLVTVPAIGATIVNLTAGAWVFAGFFAVAWLLLLFVIVRPQNITAGPLALVVILGLIVEFPLAIALETMSGGNTNNILAGVFEVGLPEELSKMIPVLVIAVLAIRGVKWVQDLHPRDYLFLGAVSGAVFGAGEAVDYVTQHLSTLIQQGGMTSIAGCSRPSWNSVRGGS